MSRSIALTVVLIAAALSGVAPLSAQQAAPARISVPYTMFTLPNGLTVILHEDHSVPIVSRERLVSRRIGQRETGPDRLRAPLRAPDVRGVEKREGRRLRHPARSGRRRQQRVDLRRPHQLLHRRARRTRSTWRCSSSPIAWAICSTSSSENMVNGQRDVVKNERRQGVENAPYGMAGVRIPELLFPKNHPYHWPVIGYMEDLTAASAEDVREFFRKYYAPAEREPRRRRRHQSGRGAEEIEYWFGDVKPGKTADPIEVPPARADGRHQGDADRPRPAATAVPRLDHAAPLLARRRRARRRRERAGRRQELAALQAARVRPADRAGRLRVPGLGDARIDLPDHRHRAAIVRTAGPDAG